MRYKSPVHGEGNVRIKGADRTSVSREAKTVNSSWLMSILLLSLSLSFSLALSFRTLASSCVLCQIFVSSFHL